MSVISNLTSFATGPQPTQTFPGNWNIQKGLFVNARGVPTTFFVEDSNTSGPDNELFTQRSALDQTTDGGGRRLAVYEYPYKDGQRVLDLGRRGQTHQFNIKFFGSGYQSRLASFINNVVNVPGQGSLTHPTLSPLVGNLTVRFKEYEFVHRYDESSSVTIKATFIEDSTSTSLATAENQDISTDAMLQSSMQDIFSKVAEIQQQIVDAVALVGLPTQILSALKSTLQVAQIQMSALMGKLAASFSSDLTLLGLGQKSAASGGGLAGLTSGSVATSSNGGKSTLQQLPPIFQSGFDPATQASIAAQISNFVNANQVTPQQAVFQANQVRQTLSQAIAQLEAQLGTYGYDAVMNYRALAISMQQVTEAAVSTAQSKVKLFTVPRPMSLRMIAFLNGLDPDRQNDIEALNPYLGSVNFVPRGTILSVPAS